MKFIFISFLVIFITGIYCIIPEYHPDQIALLILSAGSWNDLYKENDIVGNIVNDVNGNPLSINIKAIGEPEEYASIVDIIPSLRNLEPDELTKKFSKIYKLAFATFYSTFESEEEGLVLNVDSNKKLINEYDLINALINPSEDTNLLQDPKYKGSLYTSSNINKDNSLKEFIKSLKSEDVSNIDINQFNELPDDFIEKWNEDESLSKLYKAIGIQCAKFENCINKFQDEDGQNIKDISFNIASYTYNDNDENMYNYSFIIINDKLRYVYHAFTLESDKNDNFKLNEHDNTYYDISYDYINNYYVINSKNMKKRKENERVIEKGIGLLAECGLFYEDENYDYMPEYYGYKLEEIADEDKEEINKLDERLLQLYDLNQDDGTYNSNIIMNIFNYYLKSVEPVNDGMNNQNISFVKSKTSDDNILCSYTNDQLAHIEELALRFIEARKYYYADTENKINEIQALFQSMESDNLFKKDNSSPSDKHEEIDLLPYAEQFIFNRLYEVIALKKTVKYDGGIFHNNDDSELINYNEYMITQNILSNMNTDINSCIGQDDCSVFTLIEINYDLDEAIKIILNNGSDDNNIKKKKDLIEEFDKIKKLLDPQSDNNEHQTFTTALSSKIKQYKKKVENKQISSEESKMYVNAFKKLVSSLKNDYGKKNKLDSSEISLLDGNEIIKLEALYKQVGSIHNKNFDFNDKIRSLDLPTVNVEANSKYAIDKIYESFASCIELIRYINGTDNTEPKLSINMNYVKIGSDNPDMEKQISSMISDLRNLKIDGTLKDRLKQNFKTLLNTANELEMIYDEANKQNFKNGNTEKYESNSSMIYKYKDALVEAINVNYENDFEMKKMVKKHEKKAKEVNKLNIKSDIKFNLDHIVKNVGKDNMESFIINNPNSKMYLELFIDSLKTEIVNEIRKNEQNKDSPKSICPEALNRLYSLKQNIESRISEVNTYESFEGHYDEVTHLVNVMNGFNEAYNTSIKYCDLDYEDELGEKVNLLKGIYAENYRLESKLKYSRLELHYQIIDDFIKENPELFKNFKGYDSFKEYINEERKRSLDDYKEEFGDNENGYKTIYYYTADDIKDLMGESNEEENKLESISDVMKMVNERTIDKIELMNIQRSSELTKSLLQHSPGFMRNEDQINEMLTTQVFDKNSLNSNRMNLIESDNQLYNRYSREMNDNYQKLWLKKMIKDKNIEPESLNDFDSVDEAYNNVLKKYKPDYKKMGIEVFYLGEEEVSFYELKNNVKSFINNIEDIDEGKQILKISEAFSNHNENELRVNSDRLGKEAYNTLYNKFINNLDYDEINSNKYNRIISKINKIYEIKNNDKNKFGNPSKQNIGGTHKVVSSSVTGSGGKGSHH